MKNKKLLATIPVVTASMAMVLVLCITTMAQQNPAKPCASRAESRQFDFWVGDWEVQTPQGQVVGANNIQLILGDCVLFENWTGARGLSGKSFNFFDSSDGKWHQLWLDDRGGVLRLTGELREGVMRFEGETPAPGGTKTLEKLTYSPQPNGRVRQVWEQSKDSGKSWNVIFDGIYIPKK